MNLRSIAGSGAKLIPDTTQAALMVVQNTQQQHVKFSFSTKGTGSQHIYDTMQAAAWHKYVHIQEIMYELMIMTMMMVVAAMIIVVISKMLTDIYHILYFKKNWKYQGLWSLTCTKRSIPRLTESIPERDNDGRYSKTYNNTEVDELWLELAVKAII
jgi:hypothetical protein